eukprot:COSAG01_NODE_5321_length_4335_cov_3.928234_8_plen_58_part_01
MRVPVLVLVVPVRVLVVARCCMGQIIQLYKVQQFRCYRSGPRRLLGEYGGIEAADRQT